MKNFKKPKFNNPHLRDLDSYNREYLESINSPNNFFLNKALENLDWFVEPTLGFNDNFKNAAWFEDGILNIAYNCIDRHAKKNPERKAIIWQGDERTKTKAITYKELLENVSILANGLKTIGVKKGDRVCIYMPMILEAAYSMLACMRLGAVHSVVFGGFSPEAIRSRIDDADCRYVITADEGIRGGKRVPLKKNVDIALEGSSLVEKVIVKKYTGTETNWDSSRDICYDDLVSKQEKFIECVHLKAEDPSFILYTSGSTGKPKGVLHTTGGYLLGAHLTFKYIFGYQENKIFWCTADVGWITGHTYILYGPLSNGATTLMFEGVPSYPDASRFWQVCDDHKVNIFYTAPTAIRALIAAGEEYLESSSRNSLEILGTVGEPINPEVWQWYFEKVGKSSCEVVDTWWQTETGSVLISPIAGVTPTKPGSATLPFFGVVPSLVDADGITLEGEAIGNLCIDQSWPSQIRTVYGDHHRMIETYFSTYEERYFTGDGARRDKDGYYWVTGRVDDVLNVSGHRIGTAEVESAIVEHKNVAEAAVVGIDHEIKGQAIYAFVILKKIEASQANTYEEIMEQVSLSIGKIAKPEHIQFVRDLPKTRSGKIMRRILRKIANNSTDEFGDITTLADPTIVDELIKGKTEQDSA